MKHLISLILLSILFSFHLRGQGDKITVFGEVYQADQKLEYFNITVLSPSDSSIIETGTFINGYFELSVVKDQQYIIKISNINSDIELIVSAENSLINLGKINLSTIALPEIVVTLQKKLFKYQRGKMIVDVQGTSLSNAGSLIDVLQKSPGLIIDGKNNITVFGKGTPIIYINGKEVVAKEELEALQSSDIDKIEIDRNPSAQYSASGHAVVTIKTRHLKRNSLSLLLVENLTFNRRFSSVTGLQLNNKSGGFKNLLSYSYGDQNYKDYSDSYETRTYPSYAIDNFGSLTNKYGNKAHRLFSGNEYDIKKHRIGLQFTGYWNNGNNQSTNNQKLLKTNQYDLSRKVLQDKKSSDNLYDGSISYQINPDTLNSLSVILGYTYKKNEANNLINETSINDNISALSQINNQNSYNVYSVKADYRFNLIDSIISTIGIRHSEVINEGKSIATDQESSTVKYNQKNEINDRVIAGYFQAEKQISNFTLEAGVRIEYTNSNILADNIKVDTSYTNLYPSISLGYAPNDDLDINLSYSRRIRRPSFKEINPNMIYFDSLSYGAGNSFLIPEYSDNLELSVNVFSDLAISLGYTIKNNLIINTALNDNNNPDIIVYTYSNIDKGHSVSAGINYSKSIKNYLGSIEINIDKPYVKVPYLSDIILRKQPTWYFSIRNELKIFKILVLNCNFAYNSAGDDGITHYDSHYNLSAGASLYLLNRKLQISLSANDILNTYEPNNWEDRYGTIISGMKSDQDYRFIRLGVRYNFNNFKSLLKKHTSNNEEVNRL